MSEESASLAIVRDVDAMPKIFTAMGGRFTDLFSSKVGDPSPLVVGSWAPADIQGGTNVVALETSEIKFVTQGRSLWKDESTGKTFSAGVGDAIWIPQGSRSILVEARDLVTFYVQADARVVGQKAIDQVGGINELQLKAAVEKLLGRVKERFISSNPKSQKLHQDAAAVLPGGNTRSVLYHEPFPMVLSSGMGCYVTSEDGRQYVDFVSEYTACMLGHSHPEIAEVVQRTMARGINLGGTSKEEVTLAQLLAQRIPSFEKLRFRNSGTEANTMALTVALNYTKRKKILVFENGYHGGFLGFGKTTLPTTLPFDLVLARYNDTSHAQELIDSSFAAILVEPLQSVGGMIPATRDFLQALRDAATRTGAVLIFDEVVTSRLHYNGLQSFHGVYPDMTTIGKFWGGGFSFGAFGGRGEIMEVLEPNGSAKLGHSGTFNNNVFSMNAGAKACHLITKDKIAEINALGDRLREGINAAGRHACPASPFMRATGMGSVLNVHFDGPLASDLGEAFFFFMLDRGIYVARRGLIALNIMHTEAHVKQALHAVKDFLESIIELSD